jgi:predicted amidohydrolase YtcJ
MPAHTFLFWVTLPFLLGVILYQIDLQTLLPASIHTYAGFKIFRSLFEETHCYASITTLSSDLTHVDCFSISNGRFSRVFNNDLIKQDSSYGAVKDARAGYVYPGFWDGHGHLIQYGELLNSVSLFGAESMAEVQDRLARYKSSHPDEGTSKRWLRGIGWDQAKFNGKWPTTVGTFDLWNCYQ